MVKDTDSLLGGLAEETMAEMAESFFGARKEVEDLMDRMEELAAELAPLAEAARGKLALLNGLIPESARESFYREVGVEPEAFVAVQPDESADVPPKGFALSSSGRFAKQVLAAYDAAQQTLETYLYGSYSPDPDNPGRMLLSPNLAMLYKLAQAANARINDVNQAPAHVLGYLRSMNVVETQREKFTGATLTDYADSADAALAYNPVDTADYGLPQWPDLPPLQNVRKRLTPFLKKLS